MNDRELLELSAKAAGYAINPHTNYKMCRDLIFTHNAKNWNPLTDDGDALRLAVKLGLFIQINMASATAWKWRGENWFEQASDYADDMSATTRRAIVRAAAEIGRNMT